MDDPTAAADRGYYIYQNESVRSSGPYQTYKKIVEERQCLSSLYIPSENYISIYTDKLQVMGQELGDVEENEELRGDITRAFGESTNLYMKVNFDYCNIMLSPRNKATLTHEGIEEAVYRVDAICRYHLGKKFAALTSQQPEAVNYGMPEQQNLGAVREGGWVDRLRGLIGG